MIYKWKKMWQSFSTSNIFSMVEEDWWNICGIWCRGKKLKTCTCYKMYEFLWEL